VFLLFLALVHKIKMGPSDLFTKTVLQQLHHILQIAQYLSERGFAVLKYDKRGIGANLTIDHKIWGNSTINDLINDAKKAIAVLALQPEVDPTRISIIGHSQGTIIAPKVAIDNSTNVKNIILIGTVASSIRDLIYLQRVSLPLEYNEKVLDKNHTGLISIQQISKDPVLRLLLVPSSTALTFVRTNDTNVIRDGLEKIFANNTNVAGYISIEQQIKPLLIKRYENLSSFSPSKCDMVEYCPVYYRALFSLLPTLSIIGNISKSTGILLLNGENDSLTPVEQAFLLQQKLTEKNPGLLQQGFFPGLEKLLHKMTLPTKKSGSALRKKRIK
jgi:pimeloyl-ACP methyl ester carboxylesterase